LAARAEASAPIPAPRRKGSVSAKIYLNMMYPAAAAASMQKSVRAVLVRLFLTGTLISFGSISFLLLIIYDFMHFLSAVIQKSKNIVTGKYF
jgi:hypothetical protein